jgi:hypothetical protein
MGRHLVLMAKRKARRAPARAHRPSKKAKAQKKKRIGVFEKRAIDILSKSPAARAEISSWLLSKKSGRPWNPKDIYPTNGFMAFTKTPARKFQKGAFFSKLFPSRMGDQTLVRFGCPPGMFRPGAPRGAQCDVSPPIHRVDIPKERISRLLGIPLRPVARPPIPPALARRMVANPFEGMMPNPLLMTVFNPMEANPAAVMDIKIPFKEGQKVPVARFEKWLFSTGMTEWIRGYKEGLRQYKKFHMGPKPKTITFSMMDIGGASILPPEFLVSAGKSPAETYTPMSHSGKAPNSFVHEYDTQPEMLFGGRPGKQYVLKPLTGGARIDDWMRG